MTRRVAAATLGLLVMWQVARSADLQPVANANSEPFPINIAADPPMTLVGQPMRLSGTTLPLLNSDVIVTVTAPRASPPQTAKVPAQRCADGRFSASYTPPVAGTYTVNATAPDGRGHASTSFTVEDPRRLSPDTAEGVTHLAQDVSFLASDVQQKITTLPPSPARDTAQKKLDALAQSLNKMMGSSKDVSDAIAWSLEVTSDMPAASTVTNLSAVPGRTESCGVPPPTDHKVEDPAAPGNPPGTPAGSATGTVPGQTSKTGRPPAPPADQAPAPGPGPLRAPADRERLLPPLARIPEYDQRTKEISAGIKQDALICDNLDKVTEAIKWVGFMVNFLSRTVNGVVFNFVQDLAGSKAGNVVSSQFGAPAGFAETSIIKYFDTFQKKGFSKMAGDKLVTVEKWTTDWSNVLGFANDAVGFIVARVMAAYCQQFAGPITAHMHASFVDELNNRKWWEYAFDVHGQLILHYPKETTPGPVPLGGRIEGFATNYKLWENALSVKFPDLMSSAVQRRIYWLPWSAADEQAGKWQEIYSTEGSIAGKLLTPSSFMFEIKGTATADNLNIEIGPQHRDTDAKANVLALFVTVLPMSIGYTVYSLPYKPVHFIFEKAAPKFSIPLATVNDVMRGKQHFENKKGTPQAMGEYKVDIEACNPGC